ncbi:MAG: WecB/TagA/CpsF family glycosyltransferase, partial [Chlamydiia bacterium]|nr:WecB/TagA/CpsF family glycosyltransferase [Chlamydiia bacterium]
MKHVSLFGLPIAALTREQAVEEITRLTESKECQLVATVNCDFLATCWGFRFWRPKNPLFLKTLREAALLTADGMPLVWASKWIGSPLPERVTGQDLFLPLCKRLAAEDK